MDLDSEAQTDQSSIDLTSEEIIAAASAVGSAPSLQFVGLETLSVPTIETATRVGLRSLKARGLVRSFADEYQIDESLAAAVGTMGDPVCLVVITMISTEDRSFTWLYLDQENFVSAAILEPGLFRLRFLERSEFSAAVLGISGLLDAPFNLSVPAFRIDLNEGMKLAENHENPEVDDVLGLILDGVPESIMTGFIRDGGEATSVTVVGADLDNSSMARVISWFRSTTDAWSRIDVVDGVLFGEPSSPTDLAAEIAEGPWPALDN